MNPTDFTFALNALRNGKRVYRTGWNGKNMYIVLQAGYPDGISINENTATALGVPPGSTARFSPYLMMKVDRADATFVPWHASDTDLLSNDWEIYEGSSL